MRASMILVVLFALVALAAPLGSRAQDRSAQSLQVLAAVGLQMGESMKMLTGYTFQQRTAVQINGEPKGVTLVQVAFGPDRQSMMTTLSAPPDSVHGGPVMRRIEEKKIEEMKDEIQQVVQLANSYLILNEAKLQQLGQLAQVWMNPDGSSIRLVASGFQQPGDQVTVVCDGATKRRRETQVTTSIFGGPMTIVAQYQELPTGLNYNGQTIINVPGKGLQLTINTFNYVKQ